MLILFYLVAQMDILKKNKHIFWSSIGWNCSECCLESLFQAVLCSYRLTIKLPASDSRSLIQPHLAEQN